MKKTLAIVLLAAFALNANAAKKKEKAPSTKPVFTVIKEIPITSIKDQNRSGTCWNYSTLSFFEAEILKKSGKTYDLCESFVCNKNYMDRAIQTVRFHGDCQFSQGGSAYDVLYVLKNYGICPDDAMPFPGSLYGDSLNNFNEFFSVMEPYVASVAKSDAKKISNQWKVGLQGILDAYLGKCPEQFTYEGKSYTPKSFAASLGLDWNDYVSITSYSHKPFYTAFPVEVQDNWRFPNSWNLPMDEMMTFRRRAARRNGKAGRFGQTRRSRQIRFPARGRPGSRLPVRRCLPSGLRQISGPPESRRSSSRIPRHGHLQIRPVPLESRR